LFNAETQLKNSYLRLGDLFGTEVDLRGDATPFEISGELQYQSNHADLNDCLARADANRPVIKARQKDIQIEEQQYILDRSALRPHVRDILLLFEDRKSTRLNSSHVSISYAVFCLKKKKKEYL